MPQIIYTNVMSLNSQRHLNKSQGFMSTALERLSSGLRVNSAMDDAAGLAVATKMEAQARGLAVAMRNVNDGISFAQTADKALETVTDELLRMRDLATQALNGTISNLERSKIQEEFGELWTEVDRIQSAAKLNGQNVYDAAGYTFQVGADVEDYIVTGFSNVAMQAVSVTDMTAASAALGAITDALESVAASRAHIGAIQSRLAFTGQYLQAAHENQVAARSRIMDADFAAETANLTRAQILQQSGVAMVAQANSLPQNVLSLLR
ncbi:MAG: flagellin FliC [Candidatus Accumulibacter sp.]|nr:flagellin FliC [Accumulibacter sp.]